MIKAKRAQAALEFLTTYGWAFLVILVMIGALAYFGILNPSQFLPERCNFPSEFNCIDYQFVDTGDIVRVRLRQNFGKTIWIVNANCTFPDQSSVISDAGMPTAGTWGAKEQKEIQCSAASGNPLISGQKEKVSVVVTYKLTSDATGYDHYAQGEIYADVVQS